MFFAHYYELTPDLCKERGIDLLLIDIDNTLAPYEVSEPDERCKEWFLSMNESGVSTVLISNNKKDRVELFARSLGVEYFYDAHKPSVKFYKRAMGKYDVTADHVAVLGDQLLTDSLSGRRIGATVFIVPPINDKKNWFFRMKRKMEAPVMRRYFKVNGIDPSVGKEWL